MPISGLILTLQADSAKQEEAIKKLSTHSTICLGEQQQHKLPLVLDTSSKDENKQILSWLEALPGVEYIDVVYVSLEEDTDKDDSETNNNSILYREQNNRLVGARS